MIDFKEDAKSMAQFLIKMRDMVSSNVVLIRDTCKRYKKIIDLRKLEAGEAADYYNDALEMCRELKNACDEYEADRERNLKMLSSIDRNAAEYTISVARNLELYHSGKINKSTYEKNKAAFEKKHSTIECSCDDSELYKLRTYLIQEKMIQHITKKDFFYLFSKRPIYDSMVKITPTNKLSNAMLYSLLKWELGAKMNYTTINSCFNLKKNLTKNSCGSMPDRKYIWHN